MYKTYFDLIANLTLSFKEIFCLPLLFSLPIKYLLGKIFLCKYLYKKIIAIPHKIIISMKIAIVWSQLLLKPKELKRKLKEKEIVVLSARCSPKRPAIIPAAFLAIPKKKYDLLASDTDKTSTTNIHKRR